MLHTVLLILKILGILLAALLGIFLLLGGIALLVPVRYEGAVKSEGGAKALRGKMTVTWLMHLVRADIIYRDGKMRWRIRIAWIKRISGHMKEERIYEEEPKKEHEEDRKAATEIVEVKEEISEEGEESKKIGKESVESLGKAESKSDEAAEAHEELQGDEAAESHEEPQSNGEEREGSSEEGAGIGNKIVRLFKKIKCTIQSFCDKIKLLLQKKDKLTGFVRDEAHVSAFRKAKREALALLRRLKPKEMCINVRYGFGDPCRTGQVLAGISMLYPFIGENVNIIPDFEESVLKGSIRASGKVHAYYFLILLWNLFWCRDVRTTYRHIRNFEF